MRKISAPVYEAFDGKLFERKEECESYEKIKYERAISKYLIVFPISYMINDHVANGLALYYNPKGRDDREALEWLCYEKFGNKIAFSRDEFDTERTLQRWGIGNSLNYISALAQYKVTPVLFIYDSVQYTVIDKTIFLSDIEDIVEALRERFSEDIR